MKVNNVSSTNFQAGIKIRGTENKGQKYLYNELLKLTKDYKIPANFHTNEVEFPSVSKSIIAKLNELGIKFNNK